MGRKTKKRNYIVYICIAIFTISIIIIFMMLSKTASHTNSIDSPLYSSEDVDINCELSDDDEEKTTNWRIDGLFNKNNVGAQFYARIIYTYKDTDNISDDVFCSYINDLHGSTTTTSEEECAYNGIEKVEAGTTVLGWDTIIERNANQIIITYDEMFEASRDTTEEEQELLIDKYRGIGFICK